MKKMILFCLILLLVLLSACGTPGENASVLQPTIPEPEFDWGITLEVVDASATGATLHCTHTGDLRRPMTGAGSVGTGFLKVERWNGSEWVEPERIGEAEDQFRLRTHAFTHATVEWRCDWERIYGTLPDGTYRIAKTFFLQENDDPDAADAQYQVYYTPFTIGGTYEKDYYTIHILISQKRGDIKESKVTVYGDMLHRMGVENARSVTACELPRSFSEQSSVEYAFANHVLLPDKPVQEPILLRVDTADAVLYLEENGRLVAETEQGSYSLNVTEDSMNWLLKGLSSQWSYRLPEAGMKTDPARSYNRHLTYMPADDVVWTWMQDHSEAAGSPYPVLRLDSMEDLSALRQTLGSMDGAETAYGISQSLLETLDYYDSVSDWFDVYCTYLVCIRDDLMVQHMVSMEAEDDTMKFRIHSYAPADPSEEEGIWICFYSVPREECGETICSEAGDPIRARKFRFTEDDAEARLILETEDYAVWTIGFSELLLSVEGKACDLERALQDGDLTMETVLLSARMDALNGICRKEILNDGGSVVYRYEDHVIIKRHVPEIMAGGEVLQWNSDVWIIPLDTELPPVQEIVGEPRN